jgi:nucleoside-diphosphate-sugar epimerase
MKVLVTGATGFVASHLIPRLQEDGYAMVAAIRSAETARKLPIPIPWVSVGEIDGNTPWGDALQGIDMVIHLAARAHILHDRAIDPEAEFRHVNTDGTANLVRQSMAAGVKHFIFISSIGAMATLSDRLLTENSPCHPDTPYGKSKLAAEQSLIDLASSSSMTWTILRPTLVYGAGNPGNMASLVKLIQRGLPLPFGLVNNRRSFVYVGNLVDAIIVCLTHPHAKNQIFLIGDGQDLSTPELIYKIATCLNLSVFLVPVPPILLKLAGWGGEMAKFVLKRPLPIDRSIVERLLGSLAVDSSRIRTMLDWQPPYTMDVGLGRDL